MNLPFTKNKQKETLSQESINEDKNRDGIPDFLQREHYNSVTDTQKEFIKWESDVREEVEEYIMGLKGYDLDTSTNTWKPVSPPIINKFGINMIKVHLRPIVNKHSINTSLSEEHAHKLAESQTIALITNLKFRKKLYGINLADLEPIIEGFDNLATIILCRSIGDAQRKHNDSRLSIGYTGNAQPRPL